MTKIEKNYLLYTDKDQTKLLAAASSLTEAKITSLEYTEGQWFSYNVDVESLRTQILEDERAVKIKFAKEVIEKTPKEQEDFWKLGGSDLRS